MVEEEWARFKDIVQGNFHDSYRNLTYKNIFGLLWVSNFCSQAEFVVKTDDDMYVDLYQVYTITRRHLSHQAYLSSSFLLCPVLSSLPIVRDRASKWFVSQAEMGR